MTKYLGSSTRRDAFLIHRSSVHDQQIADWLQELDEFYAAGAELFELSTDPDVEPHTFAVHLQAKLTAAEEKHAEELYALRQFFKDCVDHLDGAWPGAEIDDQHLVNTLLDLIDKGSLVDSAE